VTLNVLKRVRAARNDPFAKPLYESTNGQRFSALNHLFSGRLNFGLAISKIQVLAKLKAIGILGREQTCQTARASDENAQARVEIWVSVD